MTRNSNPPGRFAPPYIWVGSPAVWAYQPQLPQSSPQVMPDSFILDLEPTKFTLVPDLGSVVKLETQNPAAVLFLQAATLPKGRCLAAGVPGFKFVTEQPKLASAPFVVRLTGAEDFVALAFKNNGPNIYLFGLRLSVSLLKDWNPPAKGDESEEAVLRLININHQSLISVCELVNTETCALKDLTERLLMYLPTFNRQTRPKVTTVKGTDEWVDREYTKNVVECAKFAEMADRKKSSQKGAQAGGATGAGLSKGGAGDAETKWADALKQLKKFSPLSIL